MLILRLILALVLLVVVTLILIFTVFIFAEEENQNPGARLALSKSSETSDIRAFQFDSISCLLAANCIHLTSCLYKYKSKKNPPSLLIFIQVSFSLILFTHWTKSSYFERLKEKSKRSLKLEHGRKKGSQIFFDFSILCHQVLSSSIRSLHPLDTKRQLAKLLRSKNLKIKIQVPQPVNTAMQTKFVQTWAYLTCAQKPTIRTGHAKFRLINHIIRIRGIILYSNNSEIFTTRINKMYCESWLCKPDLQ